MVVGQRWITGSPVVRWCLGAVVGIVILALGGLLGGLAGSPLVGAALTLLVGWLVGPRVRWDAGRNPLSTGMQRVVLLLFGTGSALMAMSFFRPVASWDAWFQWSLKSKGLALTGSFQSPIFLSPAYNWSSQDYPTLLPSWQALAYIISGDLSISWPLQFQQAWLWTVAAVALITLAGAYKKGGFLLPLAWVASPQVVWQSMQGYADVPMALMLMLGTTVLWKNRQDPRSHVLGGVLLAGAALTKTEGTPLVAIVLLCLLVTRKRSALLAIGPAIVIAAQLPWWLFTQIHGLTNQMISISSVTSLMLGKVPEGLPQILSKMGYVMFSPFRWGLLVPACVLTALLARRLDARLGVAVVHAACAVRRRILCHRVLHADRGVHTEQRRSRSDHAVGRAGTLGGVRVLER